DVLLPADLDLEQAEAGVDGASRAVAGAVDRVDADRVRGVRRAPVEAEQPPGGLAAELAREVVQRRVERRLGGHLTGVPAQPRLDRLEREGVVAEQRPRPLE